MQRREDKQAGTIDAHSKGFEVAYDRACAISGAYPLIAVKAFLEDGILDINADRIDIEGWRPICEALNSKHHLKFIAIRSFAKNKLADKKKEELGRISKSAEKQVVMRNVLKSISTSLRIVSCLTCLELQNLPIATSEMEILAQGLSVNTSIQHLSLQQCLIGDDGLEILCKVVKNCLNITSANFSYCGLTWKSAQTLVNLLKHQTICRHSDAWKETLRHEIANLDAMGGLQRLTINGNPIGDKGAHILAEILQEDIWLKAIDIQQCGLQESGARALLKSLKYNTTLYILDIRENTIRDHNLLLRITQQLCFNVQGQTSQFKWLTIPNSRRRLSLRHERVGSRKHGIPWRVAARFSLARHYNSHTPGVTSVFHQSSPSLLGYSSDNRSESVSTCSTNERKSSKKTLARKEDLFETVKLELAQLKQMLLHERNARELAEKKLAELSVENEKLKARIDTQTMATLDDRTLDTIEATFKKFNDFLKLLQSAGYNGNLIDVANMTYQPAKARRMNSKPVSGHLSKLNSVAHPKTRLDNIPLDDSAILNGSHETSTNKSKISGEPETRNSGSLEQPFISNALNAEKVYTYLSSDWSKNESSANEQASLHHAISNQSLKSNSKPENLCKSPKAESARSHSRIASTSTNSSSSIPTQLSNTSSPESLAGILTGSDKF